MMRQKLQRLLLPPPRHFAEPQCGRVVGRAAGAEGHQRRHLDRAPRGLLRAGGRGEAGAVGLAEGADVGAATVSSLLYS